MENTATVIATTKTILAQRILQQEGDGADLTDAELAGIDSIGRLSLTVELENEFNCALSGDDMVPEIFESFDRLAAFILKQQAI